MTTALAGSLAVLVISGTVRSGVTENRPVAQPEPLALCAISGALAASMRPEISTPPQSSLSARAQTSKRSGKVPVR